MGRAPCCEKVGLKRGRWTAEEDEILLKYIQANGEGSWRSLPKNAGLLRCGKSCRLRWINYLRTDLKRGNISAQEEDTIVKLHASFGNRWSLIASHLPGRTDNEIKNYWNSHLSRKIYSFHRVTTTSTTTTIEPRVLMSIPPRPRRGGRTSRRAMKKNKSSYTQTQIKPNKPTVISQPNNETAVPLPPLLPAPSLEKAAGVVDEARSEDLELTETTDDDDIFLELWEVEGDINGGPGGALRLSEMIESCLVEEEEGGCGVPTLIAENRGDKCNDVEGNEIRWNKNEDKMVSSSSSSSCEDHKESSSSVNLDGGDDNWNWESVMEFNEVDDAWEHKEKLLTWLWNDDDDWESNGNNNLGKMMDPEKQNDVIAWFLS